MQVAAVRGWGEDTNTAFYDICEHLGWDATKYVASSPAQVLARLEELEVRP